MSWLKQQMRSDAGFTVVELVVAAVILFIVSTGIVGVLAYAGNSNAADAMHQMALELANQRMEQARNMNYDDLGTTNNYPTGTIVSPETVVLSTPQGNRTFVVETVVDYSEDVTDPSLGASKNIRITVSWTVPRAGRVSIDSNIAGAAATTNAGAVEVLVVDSDTSNPVAGAIITIKPAGGFSASKTTGSDGYAKWKRVATGSIVITGTCPTHYLDMTPVSGAVINNHETLKVTVQGERASSGTVHVVDQNGNELKDVAVTITGPAAQPGWSCPNGTGSALSDDAGNAFFSTLRKGTYTVKGELDGYSTSTSSLAVIAGGGSYTSTLVMNQITTIKGIVVDSDDNPLSGVTLAASGPSAVTFASTTGTSGSATSNDMGAIGTGKTYTVTATKAGYVTKTGTVTMDQYTQGVVTIKLVLQPKTIIKVIVKDSDNNPIAGATVSAPGVTFASTTDANGVAISNDMGAIGTGRTYTVTAAKSGFLTGTGSVSLNEYEQQEVTITLSDAPVNGTLRVTNSTTLKTIYVYDTNVTGSNPIAQATVTSGSPTTSFSLPPGNYWVSRRKPYGNSSAKPQAATVNSGSTTSIVLTTSN